MSYKCLNCGHIFEDGEQIVWEESHGLDCPPYETFSGCPMCKSDYEETKKCKICGSEQLEDELIGGVCDDCFNEYRDDIDVCLKVGRNATESVDLNCFLASMFDVQEIEEILFRELKEASEFKKIDCSPFVDADCSWFRENLRKEVLE